MGSPVLRVRLLGEFDLRVGPSPSPPVESSRARSFLAWLLLHRESPQPRQRLAFLLWPDSTDAQARTNLRHLLHDLRKTLPDPDRFLTATAQTLQWRPDAPVWLDVAAFEDALARAEGATDDSVVSALGEAVDLYGGDLLEGCYDEWVEGERARLRQRHLAALERLASLLESRGEHASAIACAERILRHDPVHEGSYRQLMRLHAARGDRARALRAYHACVTALERELGVAPSAATRAACEDLLPVEPERSVSVPSGGSPFIGRVPEWARLTDAWRSSEGGRAQLVLITGEPGIGKTRLLEELRAWCAHRGAACAVARSYQAEGALAFGSVTQWLRSDALASRLQRLDRVHLGELARLLPELDHGAPVQPPLPAVPEAERRHRLFVALARAMRLPGPLLLVADDLQWCDPDSLRFLHYLLRSEGQAPLLVAAAARSEEVDDRPALRQLLAALHAMDRITTMELGRLSRDETAELAGRLSTRSLGDVDVSALFRHTEGNPLFVVESLRAGWTPEAPDIRSLSPRVQALIESRLAQLTPEARDVVGVAATVGREFTADVIAHATEQDADTLVRALDELWRRRIVREHGRDAYDFSHDRIREVAYHALSPARRRQHHLRVAAALKQLHAHDAAVVSGQVAAHYEGAGVPDEAIRWYESAAEAALRLHASGEALRLLVRARDLLDLLPGTAERQARELALVGATLAPLSTVEGFGSARLASLHRRGLELSSALGVEPAPHLLRSLAITSFSLDDFAAAQRYGEQLAERAAHDRDDALVVESEYVRGIASFWQGNMGAARQHFERAVAQWRTERRPAHLLRYGLDPQVICLSRLANTWWFLGDADAAHRTRAAALALADEARHPPSRAIAHVFAALLSLETGETALVDACVSILEERSAVNDAPQIRRAADMLRAYLDVSTGAVASGMARIERLLDDPDGAGHAPGMRAVQARVFLAASEVAGDARASLAAAERALQVVGAARLWDAEAYRVRAASLASLGAPWPRVAADLERARQVAEEQGATMLARKAASTLQRLQPAS